MEEKLDKLIALMESQARAWQKSLQLLDGIHTLMVEKYKSADLLWEEYPPKGAQQAAPRAAVQRPLNTFGDQQPYGYDIEEERKSEAQSFPANINADESPQQQEQETPTSQEPFREARPEVPVTSKAEMMEQAEKRE